VQSSLNPLTTLHTKLSRTAKALRSWSKSLIPHTKLTMAIYREVIHQLEAASEMRLLTQQECDVIYVLKNRLMGLAVIEKCRARQKSRITWLRKGDANAKYFQIMANVRKQKNCIHTLQTDNHLASSQKDKHQVIYDHFLNHLGSYVPRACSLNLTELDWHSNDLHHLDAPFIEVEIKSIIFSMPKEKAPGRDGYIGLLFTSYWAIIKHDLMKALEQLYILNQ
jgi:hypothetical protein